MTEQEARIKRLKAFMYAEKVKLYNGLFDDLNECIKALEEVEKLRKENRQLKNRCLIHTMGAICCFCPLDCENRKEKFRWNEDAKV